MLARLPVEAMRPGATIAGASPHAPNFWGKQISSGKCRHVMVDAGSLLHHLPTNRSRVSPRCTSSRLVLSCT